MADGVQVDSFQALESLEAAFGQFAAEAEDVLASVEPEIARRLSRLEERRDECQRAVEYWQRTYDEADYEEDDISSIRYRLEEAEDALRNAYYWHQRVEETYYGFVRQAQRLQALATQHTDAARSFLRQRLAELYDYAGLTVGAFTPGPGVEANSFAHEASIVGGTVGADRGRDVSEMTNLLLPEGFKWIRLADIAPAELDELPSTADYRKGISYEDMRTGLETLSNTILPALRDHPERASSDYFAELDQQAGRQGVNSLQSVYQAFFGKEHIWVDRFVGEQHYRVGNGRHRIKAAIDLGWHSIPVMVQEVPRGS